MGTIRDFYVDGEYYLLEDLNIAEPMHPNTEYEVGDLAFYEGYLYECTIAHTSPSNLETGYNEVDPWRNIKISDFLHQYHQNIINQTSDLIQGSRSTAYDFSHIDDENAYFIEMLDNEDVVIYNVEKDNNGVITKITNTGDDFETGVTWPSTSGVLRPTAAVITLSTNWAGASSPYSQVISVQNIDITPNSYITLCPTIDQLNNLINAGMKGFNVENNDGTLTAYAIGGTPTSSVEIQCIVEEVNQIRYPGT